MMRLENATADRFQHAPKIRVVEQSRGDGTVHASERARMVALALVGGEIGSSARHGHRRHNGWYNAEM